MSNIMIDDIVVGEKDAYAEFTIRLDIASLNTITVSYNNFSGSAGYGDFTQNDGSLTFLPGETVKTVRIPIINDDFLENREAFFLALYNPVNASIARNIGTAIIVDNDSVSGTPLVSIGDAVVDEAAGVVRFVVTLDRPSTGVVSMRYATANGQAHSGSDYEAENGILRFAPGETVHTITVPILDDDTPERDESFNLVLSHLHGATPLDIVGSALIGANDGNPVSRPSISIEDAAVGEHDGFVDFIVRLDAPGTAPVTVQYNNFSGLAGYGDFVQNDGVLTFAAGETVKTIRIPIVEDILAEARENFFVGLANATGATIARNVGTATLIDNDAQSGTPVVSIDDFVIDEATQEARFTIILDRPSVGVVSLDYDTGNGGALARSDYVPTHGSLSFGPGETVKTVIVPLIDDIRAEKSESFNLLLSNIVGATSLDPIGTATIYENDGKLISRPNISIDDVVAGEKDGYVDFIVRLDAPSADAVTVQYNNYSGSAGYGDFQQNDGYLTFAAGETVKTIRVAIPDDIIAEARENFYVGLYNPVGAAIARNVGSATIIDNDAQSGKPVVAISDFIVDEADKVAHFVITLNRPSTGVVSLDFATSDAGATASSDYVATAGTLNFGPGETAKTVTVSLINDTARENAESFNLVLSDLHGATVRDAIGTATIGHNDEKRVSQPSITISDVTVKEGDFYADVIVQLNAPGTGPVTVDYNNYSGTAGYGDFYQNDGSLTFAPGETTKTIRIPLVDDTLTEASESFFVGLGNATGATIGRNVATITIIDNDGTKPFPIGEFGGFEHGNDRAAGLGPVAMHSDLSAAHMFATIAHLV